jgi:hypothetical protein
MRCLCPRHQVDTFTGSPLEQIRSVRVSRLLEAYSLPSDAGVASIADAMESGLRQMRAFLPCSLGVSQSGASVVCSVQWCPTASALPVHFVSNPHSACIFVSVSPLSTFAMKCAGSGLFCTTVPLNFANVRWRQPVANVRLEGLMARWCRIARWLRSPYSDRM